MTPTALTAHGYFLFDEGEALERIGRISHLQDQDRRTLSEIKEALSCETDNE